MSFPNIPDVHPCIDIDLKDAVNLLLTSIAQEEISLSRLIDAETEKIKCTLDDKIHKHTDCNDVLRINKSVDETMRDIIKLQMLLQFKLEKVKELVPPPHPPCPPCPPCPPPQKCCCVLKGRGEGCITNRCDALYPGQAVLRAFIFSDDVKSRSLRYAVTGKTCEVKMEAFSHNIRVTCRPHDGEEKVEITGKGLAVKHADGCPETAYPVDFTLTVREKTTDTLGFRMEFDTRCEPGFVHDSGFIWLGDSNSNLRLTVKCRDETESPHIG